MTYVTLCLKRIGEMKLNELGEQRRKEKKRKKKNGKKERLTSRQKAEYAKLHSDPLQKMNPP